MSLDSDRGPELIAPIFSMSAAPKRTSAPPPRASPPTARKAPPPLVITSVPAEAPHEADGLETLVNEVTDALSNGKRTVEEPPPMASNKKPKLAAVLSSTVTNNEKAFVSMYSKPLLNAGMKIPLTTRKTLETARQKINNDPLFDCFDSLTKEELQEFFIYFAANVPTEVKNEIFEEKKDQ
jgi:hypothetical protein